MNEAKADTQFSTKTALVTGANSGLGFEAAAQLAEAGYGRVILACRRIRQAGARHSWLWSLSAVGDCFRGGRHVNSLPEIRSHAGPDPGAGFLDDGDGDYRCAAVLRDSKVGRLF